MFTWPSQVTVYTYTTDEVIMMFVSLDECVGKSSNNLWKTAGSPPTLTMSLTPVEFYLWDHYDVCFISSNEWMNEWTGNFPHVLSVTSLLLDTLAKAQSCFAIETKPKTIIDLKKQNNTNQGQWRSLCCMFLVMYVNTVHLSVLWQRQDTDSHAAVYGCCTTRDEKSLETNQGLPVEMIIYF